MRMPRELGKDISGRRFYIRKNSSSRLDTVPVAHDLFNSHRSRFADSGCRIAEACACERRRPLLKLSGDEVMKLVANHRAARTQSILKLTELRYRYARCIGA